MLSTKYYEKNLRSPNLYRKERTSRRHRITTVHEVQS